MQEQPSLFTSVSFALEWAKDHVQFESSQLVSQAPWSKTYKLKGPRDSATLKLVPPNLIRSSKTFPALAQSFPANLPHVISNDEKLGLLLLRNHGGRRLGRDSDDGQIRAMLKTYADIQSRAKQLPELLALFPTNDLTGLISEFLKFLDPSGVEMGNDRRVGAAFFIGRTTAQNYRRAFAARVELLEAAVSKANRLPATISHGDLRLKNASQLSDGTIVFRNWDDVSVGPAGLSLHAVFGRCAIPIELLKGSGNPGFPQEPVTERYCLQAYIDELVSVGYATNSDLDSALPGAICAGAIRDLIWYGDYPDVDRRYKRRIRKIIQARLSDLLDVCDVFALSQRSTALRCASDYEKNGRARRSEVLLQKHLQNHRNDPDGYAQFARILKKRGKRREAIKAFNEALKLSPDDATLHGDFGIALVEDLRFDEAIIHLKRALYLGATGSRVQELLDRASLLRQCEQRANQVEVAPRLSVSESELKSAKMRPELLALGARLFREHGFLQIDNIFGEVLINTCRRHFLREYKQYFEEKSHEDALSIGSKRYQVTVALEGPFNDTALYANPLMMQLMNELLGRKFHLGCMVCATSLPGSKDQHLHKDHRALFSADANDSPIYTPPFAITMMVPLVSLDELIGTTAVKKGSHVATKRESADMPRQIPIVPVGSCYLMDLRLSHQGLGNKTGIVRPVMNMVYQQAWFADNKNYQKQPPLRIPEKEYKKIPRDFRKLFAWVTQPGPDVGKK
jgi:tetratricopeptide (TPR) repeat protein